MWYMTLNLIQAIAHYHMIIHFSVVSSWVPGQRISGAPLSDRLKGSGNMWGHVPESGNCMVQDLVLQSNLGIRESVSMLENCNFFWSLTPL